MTLHDLIRIKNDIRRLGTERSWFINSDSSISLTYVSIHDPCNVLEPKIIINISKFLLYDIMFSHREMLEWIKEWILFKFPHYENSKVELTFNTTISKNNVIL